MDMIDRYLHAVEFWLPEPQRADVVDELGEDPRRLPTLPARRVERQQAIGSAIFSLAAASSLRSGGSPCCALPCSSPTTACASR
jgi:hypothetical protein